MNLDDADSFLNALPRFTDDAGRAYKPGLERTVRLLDGMDRPQTTFRAIHIAGTNGKGSTASLVAAIGTAAGHRVGLHTSPHLFHVSERMRIDGIPIPRSRLADVVERYRDLALQVSPSFFEFTFALSMRYFAEEAIDIAVVETGMGGRLDATNVLQPVLSVITGIGLDHTEYLGTTLEAIAAEKAGIIKWQVPVVTAAGPEAARTIADVAAHNDASFHHVGDEVNLTDEEVGLRGCRVTAHTPLRTYENLFVGLPGRHQLANAATALRATEIVYDDVQLDGRPVFEGMRHVRELSGLWGRLEVLRDEPLIVADVAHNADSLAAAIDHLEATRTGEGRLYVLLGVMRDKDVDAMARRLAKADAFVRPVEVCSTRALDPAELAYRLRGWEIETDRPCTVASGIRDFIAGADRSDALLITGSHLVVAQLEGTDVMKRPPAPRSL